MSDGGLFGGFIVLLLMALVMALYPLRKAIKTCGFLSLLIVSLVVVAYGHWGAWPELRHHLQQQASLQQLQRALQSMKGPDALIDKLKIRVMQEPRRARGWYLLGRLYASQGDWKKAEVVFLKAHRLAPDNEQFTVNYAQSLWQLNHRTFNHNIRMLFLSVLKKNKDQPDALAMLAMDAFVRHADQQAIDYWQRLLDLLAPQSEDAKAIRKAIAKAQQHLNLK